MPMLKGYYTVRDRFVLFCYGLNIAGEGESYFVEFLGFGCVGEFSSLLSLLVNDKSTEFFLSSQDNI